MKSTPSEGYTISLHPLPNGGFGTGPHAEKTYQDFSNIPKPTNIEVEMPRAKVEEEKRAVEIPAEIKTEQKVVEEKYVIPPAFASYVDELIKLGRAVRSLKFDFDVVKSQKDLEMKLKRYSDIGSISDAEYEKAKSFIGVSVPFVEEEVKEIKPAVQFTAQIAGDTPSKIASAYVAELVKWQSSLREKKEKFNKMLAGLGVQRPLPDVDVPEELREAEAAYLQHKKERRDALRAKNSTADFELEALSLTEEENSTLSAELLKTLAPVQSRILEKSSKIFEKKSFETSEKLLSGNNFNFAQESASATPFSGYREKTVPKAINNELVVPAERAVVQNIAVPEVKKEEVVPVQHETPATSQKEGVGTTPIAIPFEGGNIQIVVGTEGNPNEITVIFQGREMAKGVLTPKGAVVKLSDTEGVKGSWFLADTIYEKAFKHIRGTLKTLKAN